MFGVGTYDRLRVHVYASPRAVIKAARGKLGPKAFTKAQREARRAFYRAMLQHHCDARAIVQRYRLL
jgi:hypothetical protein